MVQNGSAGVAGTDRNDFVVLAGMVQNSSRELLGIIKMVRLGLLKFTWMAKVSCSIHNNTWYFKLN
jgi:hypothetical protein